ncbi:MAG TPA: SRPBCC family protein [Polyangia bacterium]|nr:SRPBCC family protein [Polyangia bacterium]
MSPQPTGRLRGDDLVLTRTFRAPIDDVWTSVTSSESTARWFGPWEPAGAGPGAEKKIRIQMAFEEGKPWLDGTIERCEPPRHLAVRTKGTYGEKLLSMTLSESDGATTLEFVHHRVNRHAVGELGPGWEYYLDALVAARDGRPPPKFDAYYPAQKAYFAALAG